MTSEAGRREPAEPARRPAQDDRPAFAWDFPRTDAIDATLEAFARGDYRDVRARAAKVAKDDAASDEERAAARELVSRTSPDPAVKILLALAGALLVFLSVWWVTHDGPEGTAAPARGPVEIVK